MKGMFSFSSTSLIEGSFSCNSSGRFSVFIGRDSRWFIDAAQVNSEVTWFFDLLRTKPIVGWSSGYRFADFEQPDFFDLR